MLCVIHPSDVSSPAHFKYRLTPQAVHKVSCSRGDQQPTHSHTAWWWKVNAGFPTPHSFIDTLMKEDSSESEHQPPLSFIILLIATNCKSNVQMIAGQLIGSKFPLITEACTDNFFNALPEIGAQLVHCLTNAVKAETSFLPSLHPFSNNQLSGQRVERVLYPLEYSQGSAILGI